MRLPITPQISTKDGVNNKNARLTNMLKESKATGDKAVIRPGLVSAATTTGNGHGVVSFSGELVSIFGSTLRAAPIASDPSASLASYTPIANLAIASIAHNGSLYVAVGASTATTETLVYTSTDGQTWTNRTLPATGTYLYSGNVIWSGSFWLFSADDDDTGEVVAFKSSDGITWTAYGTGGTAGVTDSAIGQGGGYFYCCVDNAFFRSSDGQTWSYTSGAIGTLGIAYGGSLIVTAGFLSGSALGSVSSDSGVSFSSIIPSASQTISTITGLLHDGTQFVAISGTGSGTGASVMTGTTGTDLTEVAVITSFTDGNNRIAFDGSAYVATSPNGAYAVSADLETWVEYSDPSMVFNALSYGSSAFNFFAPGTPGIITASAGGITIPAISAVSSGTYDFAQSPI